MIENPNIQILESAVVRLGTMTEMMAFVGGCATGMLLTDPAASPVRATLDVDVIVEVATLARYHWIADQLRQLGFIEDTSEDAPTCRWKADDVILDVMPTDQKFLALVINGSRLHTRLLNGLFFLLGSKYDYCKPPISLPQSSRPLPVVGRMII
jgi:hypothetical protein